jgi:glyoxylase-like metal-dependent hydrolase (beta-lactamase superfamily II)
MSDQPFLIDALELGPMENFVYLITDTQSGRAAVVDPAWDIPAVLAKAQERNVVITDILLTHSHHDHINGIEQLLGSFDAQLHLSKPEAEFWGKHLDLPTLHHGGDVIHLGDTEIRVMLTPGHTPGSVCYRLGNEVITGDTMFVYGCGRCDLRGGDPNIMYDTLMRMARELPAQTQILPGHNYSVSQSTTMSEQVAGNPFLHFDNRPDFVEYRMHIHDKVRDAPYHPVLR